MSVRGDTIETTQLARVLGSPAAGLLAVTVGIAPSLWVDAATFAVSLSARARRRARPDRLQDLPQPASHAGRAHGCELGAAHRPCHVTTRRCDGLAAWEMGDLVHTPITAPGPISAVLHDTWPRWTGYSAASTSPSPARRTTPPSGLRSSAIRRRRRLRTATSSGRRLPTARSASWPPGRRGATGRPARPPARGVRTPRRNARPDRGRAGRPSPRGSPPR